MYTDEVGLRGTLVWRSQFRLSHSPRLNRGTFGDARMLRCVSELAAGTIHQTTRNVDKKPLDSDIARVANTHALTRACLTEPEQMQAATAPDIFPTFHVRVS
ncbi:hypothetical protein IG631_13548 [Alternaria alternata]|nr:hypothetical protein IG631_13548 [Alternaria alternata]